MKARQITKPKKKTVEGSYYMYMHILGSTDRYIEQGPGHVAR